MLTVVVANITPAEAAAHYSKADLSGTVVESLGFGPWGTEEGVRIEFGSEDEAWRAITATVALLQERREECAFVHHSRVDVWGVASTRTYLKYADGTEEIA